MDRWIGMWVGDTGKLVLEGLNKQSLEAKIRLSGGLHLQVLRCRF